MNMSVFNGEGKYLLVAAIFLLVCAPSAVGQCNISVTPNPLTLISIDYFNTSGQLVGIQPGSGWITSASPAPNCFQTSYYTITAQPLGLWAVNS